MFAKKTPKIPEPAIKPEGVSITSFNTLLLSNPGGPSILQICGLGSDELVYYYNGADKTWVEVR